MAKLRLTKPDDDNDPAGTRIGSLKASVIRWWYNLWQQGTNPLDWAVPLFSVSGISVRMSMLYVIFAAAELARAGFAGSIMHVTLAMAGLLVLVILHEFGHCIACRLVGGEADDILLWPLGGLASCNPPFLSRAHFWTTAGGPLVHVLLGPIFALGLLAAGVPGTVLYQFNPLTPIAAQIEFTMTWGQRALWWLYYTNLVLLAFNVLVPMFPMDGGRLLQAVLWNRLGYRRSMAITINVGFAAAAVLGVFGLYAQQMLLVGVAIFGAMACNQERARLRYMSGGGPTGEAEDPWSSAWSGQSSDQPQAKSWRGGDGGRLDELETAAAERAAEKAEAKAAEKRRRDAEKLAATRAEQQLEIDRILAKIKATGMGSLSGREKKLLQQETETKRRNG